MAVLDTAADAFYVCADLLDVELTQCVGGWFTFMYVLQNHEPIISLRFQGVEGVQIFAVAIVTRREMLPNRGVDVDIIIGQRVRLDFYSC
jgi:hypothetical protein